MFIVKQPDNVLVGEDGNTKLADFGTVRKSGFDAENTHLITQHIIGTPHFMPTEYVNSGKVSAKTDTFAFGVTAMVILTGKNLTKKDVDFVYDMQDAMEAGWESLKVCVKRKENRHRYRYVYVMREGM